MSFIQDDSPKKRIVVQVSGHLKRNRFILNITIKNITERGRQISAFRVSKYDNAEIRQVIEGMEALLSSLDTIQ